MSKRKDPVGETFEGFSSEMKDSPWLSSEDLMHVEEAEVEIIACHRYKNVEFDAGRSEPVIYTLQFVGKKKELVLNSTNRKTLVSKFGTNVKDWAGKKVKLYVDRNVKMMGKTVCGVRIR